MKKLIPSNTIIDIENEIKHERAAKKIIEAHRKREKKVKLMAFPCSDNKTVFYSDSEEKGNASRDRYERKLKQFKGL